MFLFIHGRKKLKTTLASASCAVPAMMNEVKKHVLQMLQIGGAPGGGLQNSLHRDDIVFDSKKGKVCMQNR